MIENFNEKILKLYPNFDRVHGPYDRKDGRQHIVLYNTSLPKKSKGKRRTVSYPKALVEVKINRRLKKSETVDHFDVDPLNNEDKNLSILSRSDHAKLDVKRRKPIIVNCIICNKEITATRDQINKKASAFCCSRRCSGIYGKEIQMGTRKKEDGKKFNREYYTNKELICGHTMAQRKE